MIIKVYMYIIKDIVNFVFFVLLKQDDLVYNNCYIIIQYNFDIDYVFVVIF